MEDIKRVVQDNYGRIARGAGKGCDCGTAARIAAETVGYDAEDVQAAPDGSNLGLGCGNPTAIAGLQAGETVLDLGSGGGFDCFLAARAVGPSGFVIGVDMTPEMIEVARANAEKGGYANVEFRLGEIERLPVADDSVDVVISNCVINLVPDKTRAFAEAFRVLKPGGRLHVSDIVLTRDLPESVLADVAAYVGCVAGAVTRAAYLEALRASGFADVAVESERDASELLGGSCCAAPDSSKDTGCCCGGEQEVPAGLVQSITVSARKPA
jgi:SAM-dependent methyltransferase